MITNYNKFNESLKDYLKPKSEEEIKHSIDKSNVNVKKENLPLANMLTACEPGLVWLAKQSIEQGIDIHYSGEIFLLTAAVYGNIEIVKLLLELGADPTVQDNYAYKLARLKGHRDVAELVKPKTGDMDMLDILFTKKQNEDDN
jgi:hypothetical protein